MIKLSDRQSSLLLGSMLGDGSLTKPIGNGNSGFVETHGMKQHEYAIWKGEILGDLVAGIGCSTSKGHDRCILRSIKHPIFTELEKKWYKRDKLNAHILSDGHRIKCLPEKISIDELALSVWFMDDGYNHNKNRHAEISTMCFTQGECEQLVTELYKMKIQSTVSKTGCICIKSQSYTDFMNIISNHIPMCMRYKCKINEVKSKRVSGSNGGFASTKLNKSDIENIFDLHRKGWRANQIAIQMNISSSHVGSILKGRYWADGTVGFTTLPEKIIDEILISTLPQSKIAEQFGISQSTVSRIITGKLRRRLS